MIRFIVALVFVFCVLPAFAEVDATVRQYSQALLSTSPIVTDVYQYDKVIVIESSQQYSSFTASRLMSNTGTNYTKIVKRMIVDDRVRACSKSSEFIRNGGAVHYVYHYNDGELMVRIVIDNCVLQSD